MREKGRVSEGRARVSCRGLGKENILQQHSWRHNRNPHPGSTTFFFTNFPETYGLEDMWRVFLKCGRVVDVFIPPKTDRYGKKFGFVRFIDVQNPTSLEHKLDSLWLKDCFVGRTSEPDGILCFRKKFQLEGSLSVNLTPLGGDLVLIQAQEGLDLQSTINGNDKVFSRRGVCVSEMLL